MGEKNARFLAFKFVNGKGWTSACLQPQVFEFPINWFSRGLLRLKPSERMEIEIRKSERLVDPHLRRVYG